VGTASSAPREEIVTRLAQHIDSFEKYSRPHSMLMADLASRLALRLGLAAGDITAIAEAALLHDIGLYQMSPVYLSKAGPLTVEEQMDLWRHPIIGEQEMAKRGASRHAQLLVRWHHEWWNGAGYPDMLSFEDIPIGARIIRAVELFSALRSDRPYRLALPEKSAREVIRSSAGMECDPYVIAALIPLLDELFPVAAEPTQIGRISGDSTWNNLSASIGSDSGKTASVPLGEPGMSSAAGPCVDGSLISKSREASPLPADSTAEPAGAPVPADSHGPSETPPLPGQSLNSPNSQRPGPAEPPYQEVAHLAGPGHRDNRDEQERVALPSDSADRNTQNHPLDDRVEVATSQEQSFAPELLSTSDYPPPFVAGSISSEPEATPAGVGRLELPAQDSFSPEQTVLPTSAIPVTAVLTDSAPVLEDAQAAEQSRPVSGPAERPEWTGWSSSPYSTKSLLGFEASVLRHIEFRSIAIAFAGWSRLAWYLKAWGRQIWSNDPRSWASAVSQAVLEPHSSLTEDRIPDLVNDLYVPRTNLSNPELRKWFGETDAWWMDNLRLKIDQLEPAARYRALLLGLQAGDYAQSFDDGARELKRPLTTVFKELTHQLDIGFPGHPNNKAFNLPVEEFIGSARADLLFLSVPPGQAQISGAFGRSIWRESWVRGVHHAELITDPLISATRAQSKHTYLAIVDRHLGAARAIRKWAIGCRDIGLASSQDIVELVKRHRPVHAIYSKDLTEVAGGMRHHIISADIE